MSSGQPDDFFGIEYDYRGPKTESSPEKPQIPAQTSMSPQQRQEWEETEGTVDEKSNTQSDGSQIISTPYGTVRFDVTDGLHRANNSNSLLEGLKNRHQKIRQEENYLESHLFQYERVEDVNQPIPSRISQPDVVDDKENYIESQLFRYQRKEIPNVKTDWQKNKPMVISKKTHGQDFYGGSMLQSTVETQENPEAHTFQWEQEPQLPPVRQVKQRNDKVSDKQITTAEDFVKKIRRDQFLKAREELAENDKDGSLLALDRIWCQIPPINKMSSDEIANMIVKDIIFDNGDLIAIQKPYGLPIHGGPGTNIHLAKLLPKIAERLKPQASFLHIVHRIDKNTTGICLLTRSQSKAAEISKMIAERQILKKYWCLTVRVPEPREGIINIPLQAAPSGGKYKMLLATKANVNSKISVKQTSSAIEAQTEYLTLSTGVKCALVECKIYTGVKHQIRSHLGFGLSCPILGDHKYSDYMGMLPQRLPSEVLQKLGIRSQKSRGLPTYLHAKEIHIPDSNNSNAMLYIKSPLPKFFAWTVRKLKLVIP